LLFTRTQSTSRVSCPLLYSAHFRRSTPIMRFQPVCAVSRQIDVLLHRQFMSVVRIANQLPGKPETNNAQRRQDGEVRSRLLLLAHSPQDASAQMSAAQKRMPSAVHVWCALLLYRVCCASCLLCAHRRVISRSTPYSSMRPCSILV
jgi:hypothetical protein